MTTTPDTKKLQEIFNVYKGAPVAVSNDTVLASDRTMTRLRDHAAKAGFAAITVSPLAGFGDNHTRDLRDDRVNIELTQDMAGVWRVNSYTIG